MTTENDTAKTPARTARKTTDARFSAEQPTRLDWTKLRPDVYKALATLEQVSRVGLEPDLLHLVRLRASQLNHCAFCVDMHTKDALATGETVQRLMHLGTLEESPHFYTERELAALELTEAVTVLTDGFVPDEVWQRAAAHFDEEELTGLLAAIVAINAWNRYGVATRMRAGDYQAGDIHH
ncbi:hypothetical protein SLNWT_4758 [Streptomyces albus]|uniref:Carboxymuconolactone decarboxylase-like domain-containing protein n=1 Tax=Streptomyces albus (strain ATCC 21838 / DSM 41398 / FERM P-419 / JCM 4703 / NBRC 107858) TaxID=1081613 RepID=A0A0B5ETV3_STRA4|nr:hypothetical protein SLNWT_4758 [Streptomyces albus]AOU79440.1 hypothetical protein SLNHY_4749 [Streptomyces albus]AYN35166.1 carboxymuconolactone decarboxylase family protein [Streptomyces albus]